MPGKPSKRVILLCAGHGERWGNYLGIPKHLVEVDGERLVDRTVRLVRERTIDATIFIISFDPRCEVAGTMRFEPGHGPERFTDTDKFLSSAELWSDDSPTIVLYGDVFFTEAAMETICSYDRDTFAFFGRPRPSECTGHLWQEMFALAIPPGSREHLLRTMREVRDMLTAGDIRRGGGWECYRHACGLKPICIYEVKSDVADHFVEIDDFTDDFDTSFDYEQWIWRYELYKKWKNGQGVNASYFVGFTPKVMDEHLPTSTRILRRFLIRRKEEDHR